MCHNTPWNVGFVKSFAFLVMAVCCKGPGIFFFLSFVRSGNSSSSNILPANENHKLPPDIIKADKTSVLFSSPLACTIPSPVTTPRDMHHIHPACALLYRPGYGAAQTVVRLCSVILRLCSIIQAWCTEPLRLFLPSLTPVLYYTGLVYGAAQTVPTVSYAVVFAVGKHLVLDGTVPYGNLFM